MNEYMEQQVIVSLPLFLSPLSSLSKINTQNSQKCWDDEGKWNNTFSTIRINVLVMISRYVSISILFRIKEIKARIN